MTLKQIIKQTLEDNKKEVLIESFITSIWCGANRLSHTGVTWADKALGETFGWKRTLAQDGYKRYFGRFTQQSGSPFSGNMSEIVFFFHY